MNNPLKKAIRCVGLALSICIPVVLLAQETGKSKQTVVIRGRWVWDGTGRPAVPGGVVLIQGDRIVAVGTEKELKIPPNAVSIDKRDLFLMPGLVDGHIHFTLDQSGATGTPGLMQLPAPYLALRAARNSRTALRSGVTTARCAGEKDLVDVQYKRAFDEDLLPGPRVVVATRGLRPSDGFPNYPGLDPPVDGVDQVRRAVRENIFAGADFIKIFVSGTPIEQGVDAIYFTKDEIEAIAREAHRHGKKVAAHVYRGGPSFQWAVAAGVDSFEHGVYLTREEMEELKQRGIFLVLVGRRVNLPGGKYASLGPEVTVRNWYTNALAVRPKLAVGVDTFHEPGALAKEVAALVYYGMSNEEALLVATRNGGELTGLPVGTLEPGKYADVIGIRGNPLEDINALKQIGFVMKGGKVYELSEE